MNIRTVCVLHCNIFSRSTRISTQQWKVFAGLCSIIILVAGCGGDRPTISPSPHGLVETERITIGTTLKPRTLDPADSYEIAAMNLIYNMGDRLYTYDRDIPTQLIPQLATDLPTRSDDGLTYTIPVRRGVLFHDGTPFNAAAMAFSLQRFIENGGKPSFLLADVIKAVEATGEYELTIQLKKPFVAFPALLAFPGTVAVSPQAYTIGPGEFLPGDFVGTGPYQLASLNEDAVRLDVFADYWGEPPKNEGINLQIYTNNSANLFNGFQTQTIDVAYLTLDLQQILTLLDGAETGKWQAIETPGIVVNLMALNINQPPLDQVEVRQAIATMLDRQLLIDRVLNGLGEPVYSLVPTTLDAHEPTFQTAYNDGDYATARALLQTAGYSTDNPAVVELWYSVGSPVRELVGVTLKAVAEKELEGRLQFELNTVEPTTGFANLPKGIYPTFLFAWYPDFLDPETYLQPFMGCIRGSAATGCEEGGATNQGSFYWNDRVNQLITQQRQETDPQTRKQILVELQTILAQDVPYIPMWQDKDYVFAQNGLTGVGLTLSQNFPFWSIEKE